MPERMTNEALVQLVIDAERLVPTGYYRHYKGGEYWVREVVLRESDLAPLVFYQRRLGPPVPTFCRPLSEWLGEVSPGVKRYERVRP